MPAVRPSSDAAKPSLRGGWVDGREGCRVHRRCVRRRCAGGSRIVKGGGRVWQSARIRSSYTPRDNLGALRRQYLQYGYWKPFVMRKHGQPAALRHLVPGLFVLALAAATVLLPISAVPLAGLLLATASLAGQGGGVLLRAPAVIATYHLAYGLGSVLGWIDVLRGVPPEAARHSRFARLTR